MLSRALGLLFCVIGLCLPHRLRIWFSEFLGWATQGVYYLYYGLMNYLLKELRQADAAGDAVKDSNTAADREAQSSVAATPPLADKGASS